MLLITHSRSKHLLFQMFPEPHSRCFPTVTQESFLYIPGPDEIEHAVKTLGSKNIA